MEISTGEWRQITKPKILLTHGFNVRDPMKSIGRLKAWLEGLGFVVILMDYNWVFLGRVRGRSDAASATIAAFVTEDSPVKLAIGHSNGASVNRQAAKLGAHIEHEIRISPALNRKDGRCGRTKTCDVMHTDADWVVKVASFIPFSRWGRQGAKGYKGSDTEILNHDVASSDGHSDWFTDDDLKATKKMIRKIMKDRGIL